MPISVAYRWRHKPDLLSLLQARKQGKETQLVNWTSFIYALSLFTWCLLRPGMCNEWDALAMPFIVKPVTCSIRSIMVVAPRDSHQEPGNSFTPQPADSSSLTDGEDNSNIDDAQTSDNGSNGQDCGGGNGDDNSDDEFNGQNVNARKSKSKSKKKKTKKSKKAKMEKNLKRDPWDNLFQHGQDNPSDDLDSDSLITNSHDVKRKRVKRDKLLKRLRRGHSDGASSSARSSEADHQHERDGKRQRSTHSLKPEEELWNLLTASTQQTLIAESVNPELLVTMSREDLASLQVCMGDCLRINNYQRALTTEQTAGSSTQVVARKKYNERMPSNLPKYDPRKCDLTAKDFLERLRLLLAAENFNPARWHLALAVSVKGSGAQWASRVLMRDDHMTWSQAKHLFLKQFTWADEERESWKSWTSIAQGHGESAREYSERFLYLAQRLERSETDKGTLMHYGRGLREPFQTAYNTAFIALKPPDLTSAIDIALDLDTNGSSSRKERDRAQQRSTEPESKQFDKLSKRPRYAHSHGVRYPSGGCYHHPHVGPAEKGFHRTEDCRNPNRSQDKRRRDQSGRKEKHDWEERHQDQKDAQNDKKNAASSSDKGNGLICWGCGEAGHARPTCPKRIGHNNHKNNALKLLDTDLRLDSFLLKEPEALYLSSCDQSLESPGVFNQNMASGLALLDTLNKNTIWNHAMKPADSQPADHITFPVELEGEVVTALYDTGCAGTSYIDRTYCQHRKIPVIPSEGKIQLGQKDMTVDRVGSTAPLQVRVPGRTTAAKFELMDLDYPLYIGVALARKLGIGIINIPTRSTQSSEVEEPDRDEPPNLAQSCIPHSQQEMIQEAIQESLEENQRVSGFCPHPESVVRLNLKDDRPKFIPQYKIAERFHQAVTHSIEQWQAKGVVRQIPISSVNNPLNVVQKKDPVTGLKSTDPNNIRVNFDGRDLNKRMPVYEYELPKIADIFERLSGSCIYTTVDLKDAFCSFKIEEQDSRYLAFTWNGRHYKWIGAPFGLKILSFQFQRVMNMVLSSHQGYALVFVDDIIVFSRSPEEHAIHLKAVIETLTANNLKVNIPKSHVGYQALYLLGHRISTEGTEIDRRKLMGIDTWPTPNSSNIEHYLGLFNYFRSFRAQV